MIRNNSQILFVLGDLRDGGAHTSQHIAIGRLQQRHNQLETAHKVPHSLARVLDIPDARTDGPRCRRLHTRAAVLQQGPEQAHTVQPLNDRDVLGVEGALAESLARVDQQLVVGACHK